MTTKARKAVVDKKIKAVEDIKKLLSQYTTIAVVDLTSLPARQLQQVRKKLRDKVVFKIARKNFLRRALEVATNKKATELLNHLGKEPALVFTNLNAFDLFKQFKSVRQNVAAKAGQLAPEDIWVQAGPTPFGPGPVISEFAQLKIKAKVMGGKIEIQQPTIVVKAGEPVPPLAASILGRLGITPIVIGVNLTVALEKNDLYTKDVLDIDEEKYIGLIRTAFTDALKLGVAREIMTKEVAEYLLTKAEIEAKALDSAIKTHVQPVQSG